MNLHEIKTQMSGVALGPVTIARTFAKFPGAKNVLVLVTDDSCSEPVGIKVWGAASNTFFQEGMQISFQAEGPKGRLEYKEYNGKWEVNANDCRVIVGQVQAPQGSQPPPAANPPQRQTGYAPQAGRHSQEDVAESTCNMGDLIVRGYESRGYTRSEAVQLACMPAHWALNWFGDSSKPMR